MSATSCPSKSLRTTPALTGARRVPSVPLGENSGRHTACAATLRAHGVLPATLRTRRVPASLRPPRTWHAGNIDPSSRTLPKDHGMARPRSGRSTKAPSPLDFVRRRARSRSSAGPRLPSEGEPSSKLGRSAAVKRIGPGLWLVGVAAGLTAGSISLPRLAPADALTPWCRRNNPEQSRRS